MEEHELLAKATPIVQRVGSNLWQARSRPRGPRRVAQGGEGFAGHHPSRAGHHARARAMGDRALSVHSQLSAGRAITD
jgi:hypothetical protein